MLCHHYNVHIPHCESELYYLDQETKYFKENTFQHIKLLYFCPHPHVAHNHQHGVFTWG